MWRQVVAIGREPVVGEIQVIFSPERTTWDNPVAISVVPSGLPTLHHLLLTTGSRPWLHFVVPPGLNHIPKNHVDCVRPMVSLTKFLHGVA